MFVVVAAFAARIGQLWFRTSLWGDEAALALNVEPRAFLDLGQPFVYRQVAPWGVLAGIKVMTLLFGTSDMAFRALPFVGSLAAVLLVYPLARRLAGPTAGLVAMVLMGASLWMAYYAAETKPYAVDAAVTSLLMVLTARVLEAPDRRSRWVVLVGVGALATWTSLPSLFVLGACGAALVYDAWRSGRGGRRIFVIVGIGLFWIVAFAVHYQMFVVQSAVSTSKGAAIYWNPGFAPFPPKDLSDLRWYVGKYFYAFSVPGGLAYRYLAGVVAAGGFVWAMSKRRYLLCLMLGGPAVLVVVASMMEKYPVIERLLMFLVPVMMIFVAVGVARLLDDRRWSLRLLGIASLAGVVAPVLGSTFDFLALDGRPADFASLLEVIEERREPGEPIYLAGAGLATVFDHYGPKYGLGREYVGTSDLREFDPEGRYVRLPEMAGMVFGEPRVWFILSTYYDAKDPKIVKRSVEPLSRFVPRYLDRCGGRRLSTVEAKDIELVLYDLSEATLPPGPDKYRNGEQVARNNEVASP